MQQQDPAAPTGGGGAAAAGRGLGRRGVAPAGAQDAAAQGEARTPIIHLCLKKGLLNPTRSSIASLNY